MRSDGVFYSGSNHFEIALSRSPCFPQQSQCCCVVSWPDWLWHCGSSLIGYEPRSARTDQAEMLSRMNQDLLSRAGGWAGVAKSKLSSPVSLRREQRKESDCASPRGLHKHDKSYYYQSQNSILHNRDQARVISCWVAPLWFCTRLVV
jgi:hypothetical protein